MKNSLFFYAETTGLPEWRLPSDAKSQPHMVKLSVVSFSAEHGKVQLIDKLVKTFTIDDQLRKAKAWAVDEDAQRAHGYSKSFLDQMGHDEREVIRDFLKIVDGEHLYTYNKTFQNRIMRIAIKRYLPDSDLDKWEVASKEVGDVAKDLKAYYKKIGGPLPGAKCNSDSNKRTSPIILAHNLLISEVSDGVSGAEVACNLKNFLDSKKISA